MNNAYYNININLTRILSAGHCLWFWKILTNYAVALLDLYLNGSKVYNIYTSYNFYSIITFLVITLSFILTIL